MRVKSLISENNLLTKDRYYNVIRNLFNTFDNHPIVLGDNGIHIMLFDDEFSKCPNCNGLGVIGGFVNSESGYETEDCGEC